MVNKEKQAQRKLLAFKKGHFNNLVRESFTFRTRQDEVKTYEDIYCRGVHVASFIFDGKQVTFERVNPMECACNASKEGVQPGSHQCQCEGTDGNRQV